ncbi:hypothetical protein [Thalassobacillus sp. C254]|uniref:hypothetical protein n=1 Tax=Thalassobacillus sp. C254 TaxID=1225341 RepID=UPI0006D1F44A|nr:hypothetical protein [Thalassobacillus sp. C254]
MFYWCDGKDKRRRARARITSSGNNRYGEISDEWHFMYNCYYYTGDHSGQTWFLHGQSESGTHSWFDDVRIFVISEAEYNAINEGEWSNSEIERRFPYVDSVQHVLNSAIEAQGKNLLPPFTQWNLPQAISVDGYEVTMQNDASSATNYVEIDVLPHTTYTLSIEETNADRFGYREVRNADGTDLQSMQTDFIRFENPHTFTTTSQAKRMRFHLYSMEVEEDVYYKNPQLELGSQATPFTPYNPEYLYFHENGEPLKLADGEKVYQDAGRWVKSKKWETDVVLDNSLNWGRMETSSEHQPLLPYPDSYNGGSVLVVKNNGEPLKETRSTSDVNAIFVGSSNLIILLPEEDKEGYDFSTSDEVKRFFDDNPFTMNYKLAEPTTEEISREGAISFHDGKNLVNVIQGVVVREKMGFSEGVNIDWNFKREDDEHDPDTMANYKVDKIIPVYQNESLFTDYETRGEDRSFGKDRVVIRPEHYDQDADFYVTYIALPHENTAALTSVKAHYMTNLKQWLIV